MFTSLAYLARESVSKALLHSLLYLSLHLCSVPLVGNIGHPFELSTPPLRELENLEQGLKHCCSDGLA